MILRHLPRILLLIFSGILLSASMPLLAQPTAAPSNKQYAVIAPLAVKSLLLDISQSGDHLLVVGERGHILWSDDRGLSWSQAKVPTRNTLTAVHLHDTQRGWSVGHDGVVLRTQDGGRNWALLRNAPLDETPLLDVWFRNAEEGYALGAYGLLLRTRDGGESWHQQPVNEEDDFHLNRWVVAADDVIYLAAEAGMLYRSIDGGNNWQTLQSPYAGSLFGLLPLPDKSLLLFGLRGNLFRSDDAGDSWHKLETRTNALLLDGLVLADKTVVIVGMDGAVLISRDNGQSFQLHSQPDRKGITGILNPGQKKIILVGEAGVRLTTLAELESGQ